MRRASVVVTLSVLSLLVGACGREVRPAAGGIAHPMGDELVMRIETGGGFVPETARLAEFPEWSLFGDGRLVVAGPQIEIYPPPALPSINVMHISEEGIQALLREARAAGLQGPDTTYDDMTISDAPTTTFTVVAEGTRHQTAVYALGYQEGHEEIVKLRDRLMDTRWLPEGSVGEEEPFAYAAMRVFVLGAPFADEGLEQPAIRWPLEVPAAEFGEQWGERQDVRCGVTEGADLEALLEAAETANQLSPWRSQKKKHGLVLRPLLPDESGCDLA